jgi:hypothetical protein
MPPMLYGFGQFCKIVIEIRPLYILRRYWLQVQNYLIVSVEKMGHADGGIFLGTLATVILNALLHLYFW